MTANSSGEQSSADSTLTSASTSTSTSTSASASTFTHATARTAITSDSTTTTNGGYKPRYVDIGINLTDPVFRGSYHGKQHHPDDLEGGVLARAREVGCRKMIVTGSDVRESLAAVELARAHPGFLYATVGVHPCCCSQFTKHPAGADALLQDLRAAAIASKAGGHAVAFGEFGLDYDRLTLCPKETQLEYFARQLDLAVEIDLPLFLHSRAAHDDFVRLLRARIDAGGLGKRGVVHSFTGTVGEMMELVDLGFDIGINGCSMKTEENLDVVRAVPLERIQIETDGPWCEMRPSHASAPFLKGYKGPEDEVGGGTAGEGKGWKSVKKERWVDGAVVKGRNEPCFIGRVAWAVAGIKGVSVEELAEKAWENTVTMFGLEDSDEGK